MPFLVSLAKRSRQSPANIYLRAMAFSRILIIQTAFIGDVVLATALVESLSTQYPDAKLDFLLRKGNEGLLKGHPKIEELLIWDKTRKKYRHLFSLLRRIRAKRYDMVVNVQRFAATGMLTALSGARERVGFDKNPWSFAFTRRLPHIVSTPERPLHEVDRNHALIASWVEGPAGRPRLYPSAADEEQAGRYKGSPYICIAPASVWFTKQFPPEQWVSLIRALPEEMTVYLLGGPSDHALCASIAVASGLDAPGEGNGPQTRDRRVQNLCGALHFLASAALQRDAVMNYVNDSAPMHFASAVNGPVTAVYCSTIPSFGFGPLADRSFIVQSSLTLDCRPCGLHGRKTCPEGHFQCARSIRTEQLLQPLSGING